MTSPDPRQPVLVGAGQIVQRPGSGEAREPLELMEAAARAALEDTGAGDALLRRVASLAVVDSVSWPVGDPGSLLAAGLGTSPRETVRTGIGGNSPQALVNDLAGRMAAGSLDVALIAGAEAMATLMPYAKAGERPDWTAQDDGAAPHRVLADGDRAASSPQEEAAGLIAPIMFYPLLEHAVRGAAGRARAEQLDHIASLWARFSAVASENPYAWSPQPRTAREIATPADGNRLVSDPYTKLLNANITVDMGAALVLCTAEAAAAAGVPRDRWVFVHAGAAATDHWFVSERDELHRSPALRAAGTSALRHAGAGIDDVRHLDLYSCFPSAVEIGAAELGIDLSDPARTPTATGGLTFAGGPGNNYSTHGIARLVSLLREDPDSLGLATALGWYVTKHAVGVYGAREPARPFRAQDVGYAIAHLPRREVASEFSGVGRVEAYTVLFERDGSPGMGVVAARLEDGRRALAKSHAPESLAQLVDGADPVGADVELRGSADFAL